jgi:hypothetical protein
MQEDTHGTSLIGAVGREASAYQAQGFFVFRRPVDRLVVNAVARAEETVVRPYTGPLLRHSGKVMTHDHMNGPSRDDDRWQNGLLNPHRLTEEPLQAFRDAAVQLLTSDSIFNVLHGLDGNERYTLHQSIFFFVSPVTNTHLDRFTLDTVPPGRSFTVWIPIDPVSPANGPLFLVPRKFSLYDQELEGIGGNVRTRGELTYAYNAAVAKKIGAADVDAVVPFLQPGDAVVFSPSTPHGSFEALDLRLWRRAFQAIYRPTCITRWGGYPNQDDSHSIEAEEVEVNGRFNFLR